MYVIVANERGKFNLQHEALIFTPRPKHLPYSTKFIVWKMFFVYFVCLFACFFVFFCSIEYS